MGNGQTKIGIIGAGISGLIAALELERAGFEVSIFEKTDRVGGRVKTDLENGVHMDRGFQVLLESYPMAKTYLDYKALDLKKFLPGAVVFKDGKHQTLGDPLRNFSLLLPTLFSTLGSFSDKLKILSLNRELKRTTIDALFAEKEITTLQYLQQRGFSEKIINNFFKPFFSGIFLEPDLHTSSRMFRFVYKMFGAGLAVVPANGIGAIPEQLAARLKTTKILFENEVERIDKTSVILKNGKSVPVDFVLIATESNTLLQNAVGHKISDLKDVAWKGCDALYFRCNQRKIKKPIIGLIADEAALINNIVYMTSLDSGLCDKGELLSVTVVKEHNLDETELIAKVKSDLQQYCGIEPQKFIKRYRIPRGLPDLTDIAYHIEPAQTRIGTNLFVAGDHLLNGSLNAAMMTGRQAARAIISASKETTVKAINL